MNKSQFLPSRSSQYRKDERDTCKLVKYSLASAIRGVSRIRLNHRWASIALLISWSVINGLKAWTDQGKPHRAGRAWKISGDSLGGWEEEGSPGSGNNICTDTKALRYMWRQDKVGERACFQARNVWVQVSFCPLLGGYGQIPQWLWVHISCLLD